MAATWTLIWLSQTNLENATSPRVVLTCFDDANTGQVNDTALNEILVSAETDTLSWLDELGPPPFSAAILAELAADPFLVSAARDRAVILMYDRAPEVVRQNAGDLERRRKDWAALMTRIKDARQRPPTVAAKPANVGGVAMSNSNRIFVDNPNGPPGGNAGDY